MLWFEDGEYRRSLWEKEESAYYSAQELEDVPEVECKVLIVWLNNIRSITASKLPLQLESLHLQDNPLSSLPSLSHLTNLTTLDLNNTHITSLPPLPALTSLDVSNTPITSLDNAPITLINLDVTATPLTSLLQVEAMTQLRYLIAEECAALDKELLEQVSFPRSLEVASFDWSACAPRITQFGDTLQQLLVDGVEGYEDVRCNHCVCCRYTKKVKKVTR